MPSGSRPFDRFVEQQDLRIAEQCGRDAEALRHTKGERPRLLVRHLAQTHESKHLVDPGRRQAIGGSQPPQVRPGRPVGVYLARVEQGTDTTQRRREITVPLTQHGGGPRSRPVQPDDHSHRGGLAGAIGAEKSGDDARLDGARHVIDGSCSTEILCQAVQLDHLARASTTSPATARIPAALGWSGATRPGSGR
ncbi:hypothetical protein MAUB1S_04952 [Mycolicibacterium aubagnense]